MYKNRNKRNVNMEDGIWGVITALGSAVFVCYGLLFTKTSRKDFEDLRDDIDSFKTTIDKKIINYATKDDLKNLKDDIVRAITTHEHTVASRIEDKFDTIVMMLNGKGRSKK